MAGSRYGRAAGEPKLEPPISIHLCGPAACQPRCQEHAERRLFAAPDSGHRHRVCV